MTLSSHFSFPSSASIANAADVMAFVVDPIANRVCSLTRAGLPISIDAVALGEHHGVALHDGDSQADAIPVLQRLRDILVERGEVRRPLRSHRACSAQQSTAESVLSSLPTSVVRRQCPFRDRRALGQPSRRCASRDRSSPRHSRAPTRCPSETPSARRTSRDPAASSRSKIVTSAQLPSLISRDSRAASASPARTSSCAPPPRA